MWRIVPRSALLLLSLAGFNAMADELGTLFHTPEERARLDRLRRGEPVITAAAGETRSTHRPTITGYVQRSDGRNTVWIDGRPVLVASPNAGRMLEPRMVQPRNAEPIDDTAPDGKR